MAIQGLLRDNKLVVFCFGWTLAIAFLRGGGGGALYSHITSHFSVEHYAES